jgi:imidazole glycerol-phosphate synthase subunit HisF
MLKKRLIPKLQLKLSRIGSKPALVLVTTVEFKKIIEIGNPVSQAKIYESQSADELIFLDLDANTHDRGFMIDVIRQAAEQIFIPFTVGGGIKTLQDIRLLLSNGADKVSINTNAILNPNLVSDAAEKFGAQSVVVSIDYKKDESGDYKVYIKDGKVKTDLNPVEWAIACEEKGAGELLLTSIDHDGRRNGLDLHITSEVSKNVSVPVISSGGCGRAGHFIDGFKAGADAISAGSFFCFQDQNQMQTRAHIRNAGIPIRLHI